MLNYVFLGSPLFAAIILKELCENLYPPVAVVTPVAKAFGRGQKVVATEVEFLAKEKELNTLSTLDINSPQTLSALRTFEPDLLLVAAFGQIFREAVLSLPKLHCLNVHASLLPKYRGAAPIQWAIWDGEKRTGITIQKMVRRLDAGDALSQRETEIGENETTEDLLKRLAHLGGEALIEAVKKLEEGRATFLPQDESKVSFAPKIEKAHALIKWTDPAVRIRNQIRALQPWPVAETKLGGERLKIFSALVEDTKLPLSPGQIHTDSKNFLWVMCGDSELLALTEIQLENRKRLNVKEFLKAFRGRFPHHQLG